MISNKIRNRLIGIISIILFGLVISPYVITDKTKKIEPTIPLLPSTNTIGQANIYLSQLEPRVSNNEHIDNSTDIGQLDNSQYQVTPSDVPNRANNNYSSNDKGYTIQLVALKNKQKIDELIATLLLNNYDVYTLPPIVKDGQLTRLLVGNYQTKEQAETVIIDLENLTKLKGFVATK